MDLKIYNTLTRNIELFKPRKKGFVSLYTCGPTVYSRAHIGNLRTYIFEDVLKRVFFLQGFSVRHVMNITDVGHLTSDADVGEDKVEREAARRKISARVLARFYERLFKKDLKELNVLSPDIWTRATEHIKEQIELIKRLEKKGYTYKTSDGIYFDTSKFKKYGALAKKNVRGIKAGARIRLGDKKNPTDFALWKLSAKNSKRQMEWNSPWGVGFPGWHLECSAMSMKYLGETFDIHAGGVDHIPIHHTNEIAQSEAATGKKFVNFWIHGAFLLINKKRMGKSEKNFFTIDDVKKKKFHPLDFRYFVLTAKYRSPLYFSWEALDAARAARVSLVDALSKLFILAKQKKYNRGKTLDTHKFFTYAYNDLDIPSVIAHIWHLLNIYNKSPEKYNASKLLSAIVEFDNILGLNLKNTTRLAKIPKKVARLVEKREKLRKEKKWREADAIRESVRKSGWEIEDLSFGTYLKKISND